MNGVINVKNFNIEAVIHNNKEKDIKQLIDDVAKESGIPRDRMSTAIHTVISHIGNIITKVERVIAVENTKAMDEVGIGLMVYSLPSLPLNLFRVGLNHLSKTFFVTNRKLDQFEIETMKKLACKMIDEELKAVIKEK